MFVGAAHIGAEIEVLGDFLWFGGYQAFWRKIGKRFAFALVEVGELLHALQDHRVVWIEAQGVGKLDGGVHEIALGGETFSGFDVVLEEFGAKRGSFADDGYVEGRVGGGVFVGFQCLLEIAGLFHFFASFNEVLSQLGIGLDQVLFIGGSLLGILGILSGQGRAGQQGAKSEGKSWAEDMEHVGR